jgi:hypothetical protein
MGRVTTIKGSNWNVDEYVDKRIPVLASCIWKDLGAGKDGAEPHQPDPEAYREPLEWVYITTVARYR